MSKIEWTEKTWNPVTGCTKISQGCKNCYAEKMALRLMSMGQSQYKDGFKLTLVPQAINKPYEWKKKTVVFVNSMSDLFHKDVPTEYIQAVFEVMNKTPHIYQVLTKRSERLAEIAHLLNWTENIWMGVSVESEDVTGRILDLLKTPAKVKFLSIEPMVDEVKSLYLSRGIDWVICGGESGTKRLCRKMEKYWVESIHFDCLANDVPFFFKQWGQRSFNPNPKDPTMIKGNANYAKGGCELNGVVYRDMPKY
jgi:protein gp37